MYSKKCTLNARSFAYVACSVAGMERVFYGYSFVCTLFYMRGICSFFGHREIFCDLNSELREAIEIAINEYDITTFYVGEQGSFDRIAKGVVTAMKQKYPQIRLILILPYFTNRLNQYKDIYTLEYDEIIIPSILDGIHPKGAITKRNRWMVDESQLIISYVSRSYGGAYNTVKYAIRKNKSIINIAQTEYQS